MPFESGPRKLVLASSSPRRRELLLEAGYDFVIEPPSVAEEREPGQPPEQQARRIALEKGRQVLARCGSGCCVLAADTLVVLDGEIFGKPADREEASHMLLRLAARHHTVVTGWAVLSSDDASQRSGVASSRVRMRAIAPDEARAYAATGEPLDKAGGYAVQGEAGRFVHSISGLRSNVIGLPVEELAPVLAEFGVARP